MTGAGAPTVAFTGGGTGGHIYPGLAVAEALRGLMDVKLAWIGNESGMDRGIVERAGIEFHGVPSGKFRRDLSLKNVADSFRVLSGFFRSRSILKNLRPSLLFSKGGFVAVPPCAAARSLSIPVFIHESDATPGLATRLSAPSAERIFVAYESTAGRFPPGLRPRVERSGNPVRRAILSGDARRGLSFLGLDGKKPLVLFLGGSQGARQVNDLAASCLDSLLGSCDVAHQTGTAEVAPGRPGYRPFPFLHDELPDVLAAATLVVGRSGAGTLWESASLGKPMLLIPLSGAATRGDQVINAGIFRDAGAAIVLSGQDASPEALKEAILGLLSDEERLARMAESARAMAGRDAALTIAERIRERLSAGAG